MQAAAASLSLLWRRMVLVRQFLLPSNPNRFALRGVYQFPFPDPLTPGTTNPHPRLVQDSMVEYSCRCGGSSIPLKEDAGAACSEAYLSSGM
ncbi:hypothetical protein EJB05_46320, partial [Eragrostis curvula]